MTLPQALLASDTGGPEFLPIRRRVWVSGLGIRYSRSKLTWLVETGIGPTGLFGADRQQCLTPETMLAEDWEVVGGETA